MSHDPGAVTHFVVLLVIGNAAWTAFNVIGWLINKDHDRLNWSIFHKSNHLLMSVVRVLDEVDGLHVPSTSGTRALKRAFDEYIEYSQRNPAATK